MKTFISLPLLWISSVWCLRSSLDCLAVDCSVQYQPQCCSPHSRALGRSLKPLANWRFGSIFRNSIPPVRPYKVPTFEEIFEMDHSATTEAAQHVLLNLNPASGGSPGGQTGLTFSNQPSPAQLSENNRNSQIESPSSSNKYRYEDIFGGSRAEASTTTTVSYEELRKQKLLEMAKQELMKKQRLMAQRIKSQQKQEKFLKLNNYLQQQKKKISEKSPRSQQLDSFFSKIQGFGSSKTSQFKAPDLIKKYEPESPAGLIKKSDQHQEQFHAGWMKKKPGPGSGFSKFNGQQYLDKSMETKILDSSLAGSSSLAQIASQKTGVQSSRHDVVTTARTTPTTTTTTTRTTTTTPKPPVRRVWLDVDERENETENLVSSAGKRKEPTMFTAEVCEKLRVPCRFVTEHPCCSLPQDIDMMGRPRAMDGSADLKWRYYQSRGGTRSGGRARSSLRGSPEGRMMSGFVAAGYNSKIPYNSWKSPTDIRVPRYFYDGGPDLTSTILSQCWRLTYLNCRLDRQHPCCELRDRSDHQANNLLDKWLRRY